MDDWLGGADNVQEAKKLQSQIAEILTKAGFTLRKYRSNSKKVIDGYYSQRACRVTAN